MIIDQQVFIEKQRLIDESRGPAIPGCPVCGGAMINPIKHGKWHKDLVEGKS